MSLTSVIGIPFGERQRLSGAGDHSFSSRKLAHFHLDLRLPCKLSRYPPASASTRLVPSPSGSFFILRKYVQQEHRHIRTTEECDHPVACRSYLFLCLRRGLFSLRPCLQWDRPPSLSANQLIIPKLSASVNPRDRASATNASVSTTVCKSHCTPMEVSVVSRSAAQKPGGSRNPPRRSWRPAHT